MRKFGSRATAAITSLVILDIVYSNYISCDNACHESCLQTPYNCCDQCYNENNFELVWATVLNLFISKYILQSVHRRWNSWLLTIDFATDTLRNCLSINGANFLQHVKVGHLELQYSPTHMRVFRRRELHRSWRLTEMVTSWQTNRWLVNPQTAVYWDIWVFCNLVRYF